MRKLLYVLWIIAFILGCIGVTQRLMYGHLPTAHGSRVVWGLWVAMYIYFIGLSAGAFLLSSLVYVFKVKLFAKIGRLSLVIALITLICALLSIWFDLGHMARAYELITRPNLPSSMMAWMIWMYMAYFILLIYETVLAFKIESGKLSGLALESSQKRLRNLAIIGIPLAIAFHGGVGALFGVIASNPMWHSALTPIFFLVGAVVSGSALLTMIFAFFWKNKLGDYYDNVLKTLAKIMLVAILFDLLLEMSELSIALWMGTPEHTAGFREMLFGQYWYVFWIFHLLLGVIIPLWVFATQKSAKLIGWASFLVAFTFIGVRLNIVIPGLISERIKGEAIAYIHPRLSFHYFPSTMEWLVGLFVLTLGIGLFYLGNKYFKLSEEKSSIDA